MLEPQSQAAPEKFVVVTSSVPDSAQSENHQQYWKREPVEILGNQFPAGSRAVTIQRGARGFGLVIAEGKVSNNTTMDEFEPLLYILKTIS